jgi:hypothetical protein
MSQLDWRSMVAVHPAADLFPMMGDDELDELAKDIEANSLRSLLSIWRSLPGAMWQLLDGRNRVAAMARLPDGDELIRGAIGLANQHEAHVDPWAFVISANIRRRHLSPGQKRELIANVLKADPSRSNRAVAALTHVDDHTVSNVRNALEHGAEIPHHRDRVGKDGVAQPAHKPVHRLPPAAVVNNTVPRNTAPESIVGQVRVASPAIPRSAPSVVGAFNAGGSPRAAVPSLIPSPDFEARASKFMDAVAERRAAFRSGALSQRCRLAARFIGEIDVTVEELERFVNSPDDGGAT